ncbi:Myotubularin- protein 6 [Tyrophagus putrescentiae]|nr:Myotubularin- protein 6 [Tyrophagus putrescentiae]
MEYIRTPKVENVRFLYRYPATSNTATIGTLYLTATHLIFVDPELKRETWILHSLIASVEKLPITTIGSPLLMRCKHFLCITFVIPREKEAHDIYQSLIQLSQPSRIESLYCFQYTASNEFFSREDGWKKFSLEAEFKRMGCPNNAWSLITLNQNYKLCDTYPLTLYVPTMASVYTIQGSANFRSKSRLPVLTYLHSNKASISRCAQPLAGFNARCVEDERLLDCIRQTNPNSNLLYVVDTRPKLNAIVNKAQGKGYENEIYYENIKFHFFGIENIHVMRGSLQKLIDACELRIPSMNSFLSGIEGSGWLRHVKAIMETAFFVANAIHMGISVVIHCSDGWDRTSQTCSIASLILDPYYRTIDGFQAMIEKDWLCFGHKFSDRCGHISGENKEMAPVFTQFLDVIWQIMQQHPCAFEFNELFLITINDSVHNVQFGTFVGNCEEERDKLRLKERTYSLWAYLDAHRTEYTNPLYEEHEGFLPISVAPQFIKFWRGLYNRFEVGVHPRDMFADVLTAKMKHVEQLKDHILFLEEYLKKMQYNKDNAQKNGEPGIEVEEDTLERPSELKKKALGSIDLDDVERPLRVVEECMHRLELQHQLKEQARQVARSSDSSDSDLEVDTSEDTSESNKSEEYVLTEATHDNPLMGRVSPSRPNSLNVASLSSSASNKFRATVESEPTIEAVGAETPPAIQVAQDCDLIALSWQSFQNLKGCSCSTPLEPYSTKLHCYACGRIFCIRCIDKRCSIPVLSSKSLRPVCRRCFADITRSNSIDV